MTRTFRVAVTCAISLLVATSGSARTWTSSDGAFTIEAEYVTANDTHVQLQKPDGTKIAVPLAKLSEADRGFVANQRNDGETPPVGNRAEADAAKEQLEELGVRILSGGLSLASESKLSSALRDVPRQRKSVFTAQRKVDAVMARQAQAKEAMNKLVQLNVQLNARLANVPANNITLNNKLVGAINANDSQLTLMAQAAEKIDTELRETRAEANQARETYIAQVLDLRKLADGISTSYQQLAVNRDVIAAMERVNATNDTTYEIKESTAFLSMQRRLKSLEDTVLSESIPLRSDGNGSFYVSTVIDGKVIEMCVDSGANILCLPAHAAAQCGISVSSDDPEIILVLADGSEITARSVTLSTVRVGKFSVENVKAAILDPRAVAAEPLLGMSFLQEFKFQIDAQKSELTMVKIAVE